ncbi:MAG TPA: SRPBCC family protein [Thermoanaerobaculia bacterium]|nr:SRPBCC family protein [Thermoanaerobaculia bacterium]
MNIAETLQITTPSEREIAMTRVFDAPRHLVFEAYTKPELVKRWLGVRNGWTLDVCEIDLRVGGRYRYVWRGANGQEMGMGGVFLEIEPPERIVSTEAFDNPWYPGEAVGTVLLVEQGGKTTLTLSVLYQSQEVRDAILQSPMAVGVGESFDKLAEVLASMGA